MNHDEIQARVEAAESKSWQHEALLAADAVDAKMGIHRVKVDDAAVERVARQLARYEGSEWVFDPPKPDGETREGTAPEVFTNRARVVIGELLDVDVQVNT